jgi:hypothetical protein
LEDFPFDIKAGKTVIFSIFTRDNCPDLTYLKVSIFFYVLLFVIILFYSKHLNEGNLAKVLFFFIRRRIMMTRISDKCVKEDVN